MPTNAPGYTDTANRVRICREGHNGRPWALDGYDTRTGDCTEACLLYATWQEAVEAIPYFVREYMPTE